ncbi:MAG TPA: hypothetical protein VD996_06140 [Chitinophagaceae bacterium]|nr:hypothetical protein [Chitinophagaceae bacterium]
MAYVAVRSFDNYIYANILLSRLKDAGFDCYLKDENTVTIDPLLSPAIGGMKLMVLEKDLIHVRVLLDEIEAEYLATVPCPQCGKFGLQKLTKTNTSDNLFKRLIAQLIQGSAHSETQYYRCSYCGHKVRDIENL